jgi:hypothetical protein
VASSVYENVKVAFPGFFKNNCIKFGRLQALLQGVLKIFCCYLDFEIIMTNNCLSFDKMFSARHPCPGVKGVQSFRD